MATNDSNQCEAERPKLELTTNCEGKPAYAYLIDEVFICDPGVSQCGRFEVDPLKEYGLTPEEVQALEDANEKLTRGL